MNPSPPRPGPHGTPPRGTSPRGTSLHGTLRGTLPRRRRSRAALALTAALGLVSSALAALTLLSPAAPAAAQSAPGASVPFTEYDAVNAATNGQILGPDYYFGTLASEATGRQTVLLSGQGEYVQFTLTQPANAVDFHYAIPDSAAGSGLTAPLDLYVNGTLSKSLQLTSDYSWLYGSYPFTNTPSDGLGHDFYDDMRTMFGSTLPAGTTVKLQIDSGDNAPWYAINTADFEDVPAATASPAGYINATASPYNADPTGASDSTDAIQNAIDAASAAGTGVYLPQGTYLVSSQLSVNDVTVTGAGPWYTEITGTDAGFSGSQSPASNDVTVSNLSIFGTVNDRVDSDSSVNGFNGGFSNSTISNVWIQNTKVGIWVDGPATNLTITGVRIQDTTADGVNFDGGVTNSTVENTFTRNTQDDGMAMWSNGTADTGDTFTQDTVDSPGLANNFAIYGGSGDSITNDVGQDTITQGGGIQVANRFSSVALSGTTTVSGNLLVRTGQFDPNWHFGVGAIWLYADDSAMSGTINITNNTIENSPFEAFQFIGSSITNVNISGDTISGAGTFAFQDQAPGSVSVSSTTATGLGDAGIYDCGSGMTITQGSGNSGWSTTVCGFPASQSLDVSPDILTFEDQGAGTTSASQPITVLDGATAQTTIGAITATSGFAQTNNCGSSLGTDSSCTINVTFTPAGSGVTTGTLSIPSGEPGSPTTVTLVGTSGSSTVNNSGLTASPSSLAFGDEDVGSTSAAQAVTVTNPGTAPATISSISVTGQYSQTNNCGGSLAAGASCTVNVAFSPTSGGSQTGTLSVTNSAATLPLAVSLSGLGVTSTTNLALGATMTASGSTQTYVPSNANDGNTSTYWESTDNDFPQWLEANLGSAQTVGSIVLDLPPSTAWATRTQTLSVLGSTNGSSWTTLVPSASYTFNPSTGNTVTISLPVSQVQYLQLNFTANSGWPAGQVSEFEIFPGSGTSTPPNTDLALGQPATASSYYESYVAANAVDGNTSTYWESSDGAAYPQTLTVDLGSVTSVGSVVLDLPPSTAWTTRTETLSVLGSSNGTTFSQIVGSAGYTFNPSTGNTVTIDLPSGTSTRYLQLSITANTGWGAAQISEFGVFAA
jgi:hypothetical protein